MSKPNLPPKLPQGGGSFLRQPDGGLSRVEKPTANPALKPAKAASPDAKSGSTKESK